MSSRPSLADARPAAVPALRSLETRSVQTSSAHTDVMQPKPLPTDLLPTDLWQTVQIDVLGTDLLRTDQLRTDMLLQMPCPALPPVLEDTSMSQSVTRFAVGVPERLCLCGRRERNVMPSPSS